MNCPECKGTGFVSLLLTKRPCKTCSQKPKVWVSVSSAKIKEAFLSHGNDIFVLFYYKSGGSISSKCKGPVLSILDYLEKPVQLLNHDAIVYGEVEQVKKIFSGHGSITCPGIVIFRNSQKIAGFSDDKLEHFLETTLKDIIALLNS